MSKSEDNQAFPNGFTKVDHNFINMRDLLRQWSQKVGGPIPESLASLHIDLERNMGHLSRYSVNFWCKCWGWHHSTVKRLFAKRELSANLARTEREDKSNVTSIYEVETRVERELSANLARQSKEEEKEKENIGELFAEIWTLYPGRWRPNERPKKGSKQDALKVFKRFAKDGARILEAVKNAKIELSGKRESFLPDLHRFIGKEIYLDYLDVKTEKQQPELTPAQQRALFAEREAAKVKR